MTNSVRTTRTRSSAAKAAAKAALELLEANETNETQLQVPVAEPTTPEAPAPATAPAPAPVEAPTIVESQAQPAAALDEGAIVAAAPAEIAPAWQCLPAVDAPAQLQLRSYKMSWGTARTFVTSSDGGVTNEDSGVSAIIGVPVDLTLEVSASNSKSYPFDARLRLAMMDQVGELIELNLNSVATTQQGETYCTGPVRSLISGLMGILDSADDLAAFRNGCRFEMVLGDASKSRTGRASKFINLSLNVNGRWVANNSARYYSLTPRTPQDLVKAMEELKAEFRTHDLFMASPAVTGGELVLGDQGMASAAVDV